MKDDKKGMNREHKNGLRSFVVLTVAIVAIGSIGVAAAAMISGAFATGTLGGAGAPSLGASDPGSAGSAAPASAVVPASGSDATPALPGAQTAGQSTCEAGADPSSGTYGVCLGDYEPNVNTFSSVSGPESCYGANGGGSYYGWTHSNITTNAPASADYKAYQGNVAHADATEKSGSVESSNSFYVGCYGFNSWEGAWGYVNQGGSDRTDSGSHTNAPVYEYGPANPLAAVGAGFSQQNTTYRYQGGGYSSDYNTAYGRQDSSWDNNDGNGKNQDTYSGAGTSVAGAGFSQNWNTQNADDYSRNCGGGYWQYSCSSYESHTHARQQDSSLNWGASTYYVPDAPSQFDYAFGSVSQTNDSASYCNGNGYCNSYSDRQTAVTLNTYTPGSPLSPHTVSVGQDHRTNSGTDQGCKQFAVVDGVDYTSFVPGSQTCEKEIADVPLVPQVDLPVPGQAPHTPVPLPPLPPLPALPPVPPLPHP
ncbi:MAG: hypothetical protein ACYDCK_02140 [Thermoplasmatota archaeon]